MITKQEMLDTVKKQLAVDYNCNTDDFNRDGIAFTKAVKLEGRRKVPFLTPRCEVITMGSGIIVNASADVLNFAKKRLNGKTRSEVLNAPFLSGSYPYFLPDLDNLKQIGGHNEFEYRLIEKAEIHSFYKYKGLTNALRYNEESKTPEILAAAAYDNKTLAGIVCATKDSEKMCQIGVDVLPEYRHRGIAAVIVNKLTFEVLNRDLIPYYFTDNSNLASQKTALRAGYFPAWVHTWKNSLFKPPFSFLNYIKY